MGFLSTVDWPALIQAGCGTVAIYLAVQIKTVLKSHETRLTALEAKYAVTRSRKRKR